MSEKYNFTIDKRGYNTEQVDGVIDDLESKNKYLGARVSELEQKLDTARRLIRRFSDSENGLRQSIADSKRAAASMLSDTKERSDILLDKTRESCGEIISDLDMKIADKLNTVEVIKNEVASFKDQLFALYSSHIDLIESIAATAENFEYAPDYSGVSSAVDEFEASQSTEVKAPEFPEYPEESIFENFDKEETEDFVIKTGEEEKPEENAPAESTDEASDEEFVYEETDVTEDTDIPEEEEITADSFEEEMLEYFGKTDEIPKIDPETEYFEEVVKTEEYIAEEEPIFEEEPEIEIPDAEEVEENYAEEVVFGEKEQEEYEEAVPVGDISDEEYYRFLENFINEDDGTLSDPE